jgi:hypothetical protein
LQNISAKGLSFLKRSALELKPDAVGIQTSNFKLQYLFPLVIGTSSLALVFAPASRQQTLSQ